MRAVAAVSKRHPGIGRAQGPPHHGNVWARTVQYLAAGATAHLAAAVDIQMLANAPGILARPFGILAIIFAVPIDGTTSLALLPDCIASCCRSFGIDMTGRRHDHAIHASRVLLRDPAIGDIVCNTFGLAVERVAKAAAARCEEDEHVAMRQGVARLGWQVLDRAATGRVSAWNRPGRDLLPHGRPAQH